MKIKLVKFEDFDFDGSNCLDYGLTIGCAYKVTRSVSARGLVTIINEIGEEINIYTGEYEVVND